MGESTDRDLVSVSVFSSSASGEKSGLPLSLPPATNVGLEVSEGREMLQLRVILLRVGVHGAKTGIGIAVVACGEGEDVRRMSATAAMMGAVALSQFLAGDASQGGCVAAAEGRVNTGSVGEDGAAVSAAESARPRDLRRCARLRSSSLACSRASSASLRASASADMRGLVAVEVRAHSGTTYGALNVDDAGRDSGAAMDVAIVVSGSEDVDTRWPVFGGEGKAAATRALRAAKRSAFTRGVCGGVGLFEKVTGSESNGRDKNVSLRLGGELSQYRLERPWASATSLKVRLRLGVPSETVVVEDLVCIPLRRLNVAGSTFSFSRQTISSSESVVSGAAELCEEAGVGVDSDRVSAGCCAGLASS